MFSTAGCARFGHPEITFVFAEPVAVPGLSQMLLRYFENQVARGVRFLPGQTVDIGGSTLRLFDRGGLLGVRDLGPDGNVLEPESAHRSLLLTWRRQEVARSYGLLPEFPKVNARAVVCTEAGTSRHALLLKRMTPSDPTDSGWYIGCTNEAHDHDATESLQQVPLHEVPVHLPWLDQFLALPHGTDLVVEMHDRVRVPVLWRPEHPEGLAAIPGSYVAALNAAE